MCVLNFRTELLCLFKQYCDLWRLCRYCIWLSFKLPRILAWHRLLQSPIALLQRVQNTAPHLVFELSTSDHVTVSLLELHWLPVPWRNKSNCAPLCTQFSMADVLLIWPPLCSRLMAADHTWVNVLGQRRRLTSHYRSYVPSWESMLSRMTIPLHGTQCPNTSVLNLTFVFLRNCWRHIF